MAHKRKPTTSWWKDAEYEIKYFRSLLKERIKELRTIRSEKNAIIEKAKAYDGALEQAKKELSQSGPDSDSARQIKRFFPELAENKGERIRKALVEIFSGCIKDNEFCHTGFTYAEITAWLEKQKEQKPADGKKYSSPECGTTAGVWSEEDKTNGWAGEDLSRYLSCLQRLGTGNPQQPETINSQWFKEHCRSQSKPSWNEEDIHKFNRIATILGEAGTTQCWYEKKRICEKEEADDLCAFLKLVFNRFTEKQITKRSEEDLEAIDMCLDAIPKAWKTKSGMLLTKWLKEHLCPSWKPSEEHFQALRRAIMKADKGSDAETWLIDLCEQLKKLI